MAVISMKELLEAGVHFGHQKRRWDPKMAPYIFTQRKGIHIIDLQKTLIKLKEAYEAVKECILKDGTILFVGTKKQAQVAVETEAKRCGMPYVVKRWLGGTLTNFSTIRISINKLKRLEKVISTEDFGGMTKKEIQKLIKRKARLERLVGGIRDLDKIPDMIFIIDPKREENAVREARKLGVPIVAIVDTNCDPTIIDYPIPGNDDAIRAISLFSHVIANAVLEARNEAGREYIAKMSQEESENEEEIKTTIITEPIDKESQTSNNEATESTQLKDEAKEPANDEGNSEDVNVDEII